MIFRSHWSPRYIVDRTAAALHRLRFADSPWITARATEFLGSWLRDSDKGLEWGAGRSTLWLGARVGQMMSVEHDETWFRRLRGRVAELELPVDLRWSPAERPDATTMYADQRVINGEIAGNYARQVEEVPDGTLDFALVDGMWRDLCFQVGIRKIRSGGLLVLDNANWSLPSKTRSPNSVSDVSAIPTELFRTCWDTVRHWRCYWTSDGVSDTAIFFKP